MSTWVCRYECGHFDCQDERGRRSKCPVCEIPVPEGEGFTITREKRTYTTHVACAEVFTTVETTAEKPAQTV